MSDFHPGYILNAVVYAVLGIIIFSFAFVIIDKMTPYDLWKEICETAERSAGDHGGRDVDRCVHHHRRGRALKLLAVLYYFFPYS